MKSAGLRKVLSLVLAFTLIYQQAGFAQGLGQLDLSGFLSQPKSIAAPQIFRPVHLRYLSYDHLSDNFKLLLDKRSLKDIQNTQVKQEGQVVMKYFLVGITLPDQNFWVNLRPDSEDQIIDPVLARTDLVKVLLEADLQLKKDVAKFTSPETAEGKAYWDALYKKAGEIFQSENITIPTLTRPWIVPGEVIIRENADSAYVYKGTLKVMLEQDHLKNSADYNFADPRLKELNEYSSQLIRQDIIPKLTREVNSSQKYAALRQVFYSLILARWFKAKFAGKSGMYSKLINSGNLNGLASESTWSKTTYFKEYQKSFSNGEYNLKEQVNGAMGPTVRTYFSGGVALRGNELTMPRNPGSTIGTFSGTNPIISEALAENMSALEGKAISGEMPNLTPATFTGSPEETSSPVISRDYAFVKATLMANPKIKAVIDNYAEMSNLPDHLEDLAKSDDIDNAISQLAKDCSWPKLQRVLDEMELTKSFTDQEKQELYDSLVSPKTASSPLQIKTELAVPEGQKKGFFTHDYQQYRIADLFRNPVQKIPDAVVKIIQDKLNQDVKEGRLKSALVIDTGATDINIHVTHNYGELNAAVQKLVIDAVRSGCLKAQELGLLKNDINAWSSAELTQALRLKHREHSITERGSEPVVIAQINGAGIGASNLILYHEFFIPGATPLVKLGFTPIKTKEDKAIVRGFRAIVRRTGDIFKGKTDGDVWEFEFSSAATVDGVEYKSVNQSQELLALASQPNDYVITEIYAVEGSAITSIEPLVSVAYQPVYGEQADARTLNPTFLFRSQSGADAVGGVASMFYHANFVPGGHNGERFVTLKPVTFAEARKAPEEGTANVLVYGWQSEQDGAIARLVDHVGLNPPALGYIRRLAGWLAGIMKTHQNDQPYLAPFAAEEKVKPVRKEQAPLFNHAPKEAELDPVMDQVEQDVAAGRLLAITNDKADMGGDFGHNYVPDYMSAVYRATLIQEARRGTLREGNIIGYMDKGRLRIGKTTQIGDDGHQLMIGDKTRNSAAAHQISFLAFTRAYLIAVASSKKPYGLAQDYQGKEAKAAKKNPYFYSHLNQEFIDILREVMPKEYLYMVDNMEAGWRKWEETKETVTLPEPFSGNVSQQGIGSARFLMDFANGERTFGILAGDKMGPAGINRVIREGIYAALKAGKFVNGLVFEIWDAKAFDEDGNIPLDKLPVRYEDIADAVGELKDPQEQALVKSYYAEDGSLKANLEIEQKERLASLLKKSGYVPTERIFLDAERDKETIYAYLADSDRFNIKQVWIKKSSGWDINKFQDYLLRPILGSSVTKLGILAGGEYVGKDDPVMVGNLDLMEHIWQVLEDSPMLLQGDMNGSHWLGAIPTKFKYAVANVDSHPIFVGLRYTLDDTGKIANVEDVFSSRKFDKIRNTMFKFNFMFKWVAAFGGQFAPYGTDVRTVEASYPLAKLLRQLQDPASPFLVRNMPAESREKRPIGIFEQRRELFETAASLSSENLPLASSPITTAKTIASSLTEADEAKYQELLRMSRDYEVIKTDASLGFFEGEKFELSQNGFNNVLGAIDSIVGQIKENLANPDAKDFIVRLVGILETLTHLEVSVGTVGASHDHHWNVVSDSDNRHDCAEPVRTKAKETIDQISPLLEQQGIAVSSSPVASNLTQDTPERVGGIDFRTITMITKPMGSLSGLKFSLPKLSNVDSINLDNELSQIQNMLKAGITPSIERLKEYVAACYQKGQLRKHLGGIVNCLVDTCKLEEEKVAESTADLKELLLLIEATR